MHMRVKVHSPTPPPPPVRDVSLSQLAPHTAYRALETETTVRYPHRVSPSGIRAGLAGGLLTGVDSVFTLVTGC